MRMQKGAVTVARKGTWPRERTGAHRKGLWVAALHPVRPLSHTHPAARRPPRPSDGPGARGGSGGPSAADTRLSPDSGGVHVPQSLSPA